MVSALQNYILLKQPISRKKGLCSSIYKFHIFTVRNGLSDSDGLRNRKTDSNPAKNTGSAEGKKVLKFKFVAVDSIQTDFGYVLS